jgi:predicted enzyme related to lactoylglutathione lyase
MSAESTAAASSSSSVKEFYRSGSRSNGEFCWFNLMTPSVPEAQKFFASLLGWEFSPIPPNGAAIAVKGQPFGAIFPNACRDGSAMPAGITIMFRTASAADTVKKVQELGGTVKQAPFKIVENLVMAAVTDETGAHFDLFEPLSKPGTEVDSSLPGAPTWIELITSPTEKGKKFYGDLFGWTATESKTEMDAIYTTFHHPEKFPVAGMFPLREDMKMAPHWAVYFNVENTDETVKKAQELGAKICLPQMDVKVNEAVGARLAGIVSPQGVYFYVIHYSAKNQ